MGEKQDGLKGRGVVDRYIRKDSRAPIFRVIRHLGTKKTFESKKLLGFSGVFLAREGRGEDAELRRLQDPVS